MFGRNIVRQSRRHSTQVLNPVIRSNVFSHKHLPSESNESTSSSNPLLSLPQSQFLALKPKELSKLLSIPFKSVQDSDRFCSNFIQIIHGIIVKDPARARSYIKSIPDANLQDAVVQYLRTFYKEDTLRRSIVSFLTIPESGDFAQEFLETAEQILQNSPEPKTTSAQIFLSYMKKLALSGSLNPNTVFLEERYSQELLDSLPRASYADLYGCLAQLNVKFQKAQHFEKLKTRLLNGSAIEKMVARTGLLDLKWHDTEHFVYSETQKKKMVSFFGIQDLAYFCKVATRNQDVVLASLYLNLLVTKFEELSDIKNLHLVLDSMLTHSMTFNGPHECLKFLRYLIESDLEIVPATMLRVLVMLRTSAHYDEALLMINYLHSEKLSPQQRATLVEEIVQVITKKFSEHPKVAIGYFASLFDDGSDSGLKLLQELSLLDLVYGADASALSTIERADLHEDLTGSKLSHSVLKDIYDVVLKNTPHFQSSNPVVIRRLFDKYFDKVTKAIASRSTKSIFHPRKIDESVLSLFMDHLLRVDPYATDNLDLVQDNFRFVTAKEIFQEFQENVQIARAKRKPYIFDLLISSALLKHHDLAFAVELFKYGREHMIPISFNQIYPFVMYHHLKKEDEKALKWYNLLVESGATSKSVAATQLLEIAKKQNWPVKGTSYLTSVRKKNRSARQALKNLNSDPMKTFLDSKNEKGEKFVSNEFKFHDELASILNEISTKKREEHSVSA